MKAPTFPRTDTLTARALMRLLAGLTYKPSEELHGGKFRYTLRVTPRGKVWLAAKYMAYLDVLGFSALENNEVAA